MAMQHDKVIITILVHNEGKTEKSISDFSKFQHSSNYFVLDQVPSALLSKLQNKQPIFLTMKLKKSIHENKVPEIKNCAQSLQEVTVKLKALQVDSDFPNKDYSSTLLTSIFQHVHLKKSGSQTKVVFQR